MRVTRYRYPNLPHLFVFDMEVMLWSEIRFDYPIKYASYWLYINNNGVLNILSRENPANLLDKSTGSKLSLSRISLR
jgi:hypothetical protein